MSQKLVNRNEDLSRLRADGYDVLVSKAHFVLVRNVPYLNGAGAIKRGILASPLGLAGEQTVMPNSDTAHVAYFVGEEPHLSGGVKIGGVTPSTIDLGDGLAANFQISHKPTQTGKYPDYYEKMRTYIAIVSNPATAKDENVSAQTYPVVVPDEDDESPFHYIDTGPTNNGIVEANSRFKDKRIAIVGLGGTGAYVLDLVAKTPVREIHLFDYDMFINHNAFRCPGATSLDDLSKKQQKVNYLATLYGCMHKGVIPHDCLVDESNVEQLRDLDFIFLCIDRGSKKKVIVERLEEWGRSFIDVGMGIQMGERNALGGTMTVTTSVPNKRDHFRKRVALTDGEVNNDYSRNVQIADLSVLNATLAVIKWKKLLGYYDDTSKEHFTVYTVRSNTMIVEDKIAS